MQVNITELLTVKNFATQLGLKQRNKAYSAQYIYKLINLKKIKTTDVVEIDGVSFVRVKALDKIKVNHHSNEETNVQE